MALGGLIFPATIRNQALERGRKPDLEPEPEPEGGTLYQLMHGGWGPPVERAEGISQTKPALEQSFAPHEQATMEDVRGSLGHILMGHAPISATLPGISPKAPQVRAPESPRRGGASLGKLAEPDIPAGETYFSQLRRTIDTKHVQEKQGADQWLRFLRKAKRGVHEDEIKWTGLGDLLKAKGRESVTKKEMRDHLDANEIRVEVLEKRKDATESRSLHADAYERPVDETKFSSYTLPGAENYREVLLTKGTTDPGIKARERVFAKYKPELEKLNRTVREATGMMNQERLNDVMERRERLENRMHLEANEAASVAKGVRFPSYEAWLEREITPEMRGPRFERENRRVYEGDRARAYEKSGEPARGESFTGGHWDEPNVLAHLRLSDRTVGGKRTLLIEEIQSDWAQKGRSEGFAKPNEKLVAKRDESATGDFWRVDTEAGRFVTNVTTPGITAQAAVAEAQARIARGEAGRIREGVPAAPFVEKTSDWTKLGLKRVLKMAADEGYDKVGIVRGAEQAERYDLSKQVKRVEWNSQGGALRAYDLEGELVITKDGISRSSLSDYIGKEAAQKLADQRPISKLWDIEQVGSREFTLINEQGQRVGPKPFESRWAAEKYLEKRSGIRRLEGIDLKVGGEGMKGYYDKIVPETLNKLGKEFGVKVEIEGGEVPGQIKGPLGPIRTRGTPIHTLDVPEPMKKKVKKKGFPLVSSTLGDLIGRTA